MYRRLGSRRGECAEFETMNSNIQKEVFKVKNRTYSMGWIRYLLNGLLLVCFFGAITMIVQYQYVRVLIRYYFSGSKLTILSVQGPHARALLEKIMFIDNTKYEVFDLNNDEYFPFSYAKTNLTINGYPIEMTLRLTFVGEVGYELRYGKTL